jgi:hypothetical protein
MPAFTIELPNGKRLDVEADDENAALTGAQGWYKQNVTDKTDTSVGGTLQQGLLDIASGVGKTAKEYVNKDAGNAIMGAAASKADPRYKPAYEGFVHPEDGADNHTLGLDWSKAPRALLEQAPGLAMDVGTQMLLKKLGIGGLGRTIGGMLTFGARTAGNEAQKRTDARTGTEGADPTTEDKLVGAGSTVAQAALNTLAAGKLARPGIAAKGILPAAGNVLAAAGTEGATNAAQDLISQGAAKVGTNENIDLKDTLAQGVLGTAGGGTFAAPHMVKAAAQASSTRGTDYGSHSTLAANRLTEKAGGVEKLEDPKTAYNAMRAAQDDVSTELNAAARNVTAPSTETANALSRAQSGEVLNSREMSAIDAEGNDALSSLVRQQAALAKMTKRGNFDTSGERWAAGASETARKYSGRALSTLAGVPAALHMAANGMSGIDTITAALPGAASAVAGGVAGYQALKKIEKMAGVHSPGRAFAERFADATGQVRPDAPPSPMTAAGVSVPQVTPQNSLTTPQPWGPVAPKPTAFKPDMLDSNIAKIVEKIQRQKQRSDEQELRALLRANKPAPAAPGMDAGAAEMQIKSALNHYVSRKFFDGRRQAEAEAAESPMINEQGGLDAVRNPAMGKRANELISAANALARLRRQPEPEEAPTPEPPVVPAPAAPVIPGVVAQPKNVDTRGATPQAPEPKSVAEAMGRHYGKTQPDTTDATLRREAEYRYANDTAAQAEFLRAFKEASRATKGVPEPEPFVLPESPHVFKDPKTAAAHIYADAVAGGKEIRNAEGYKAGTQRRLAGEEAIYERISKALNDVKERGDFHKYLAALWGSDSPEVVTKVREHMLSEFPHHADTINKHLSDEAIKGLWTKPKKKK